MCADPSAYNQRKENKMETWITPDFEDVSVCFECTAYAGELDD